MDIKKKDIVDRLRKEYQGARPELEYKNPYELLVATILSAQCTDKRVNIVTKTLFKKYPDPSSLSKASYDVLCEEIHSCGFYQAKATNLINTAKMLCEMFGGEVPKTLEELTLLPGVGRKTANVVLFNAFGKPAFAVDTHVFRVSNRLGIADSDNVLDTEKQLTELIDENEWGDAHHWLIYHGRRICASRKPKCHTCFLNDLCRYYNEGEK